jgi:hypothetical protein
MYSRLRVQIGSSRIPDADSRLCAKTVDGDVVCRTVRELDSDSMNGIVPKMIQNMQHQIECLRVCFVTK